MTTIHARRVGDSALVPYGEFRQLLDLARQYAQIELKMSEDDTPTLALMRLAEEGGSFDFWMEEGEDVYSATDGDPA